MRTFEMPGERYVPDAMQFSPDGRYLAIQANGRVDVLDSTTGTTRLICSGSKGKVGTAGVGFSSDSRCVLYFNEPTHNVHSFNLETGQDQVLRHSQTVAWSSRGDIEISASQPDGRLVFVAVTPQARTVEIVALDPISGKEKFAFARHRGYLRELAISADGQRVVGCSNKDLRVWGIGDGKLPNRADWHIVDRRSFCFGNLALARDGVYLAIGGYGGLGQVRVWDLKARVELNLENSSVGGGGVAFAPDRPLLAFTQHAKNVEVVFWDARTRVELKRYDWHLGRIEAVAFSLDGCRCATASRTKAVIWDVDV